MSKHVFIIGITGCIGGAVFTSIKAAHPEFTYSALVRNPSHVDAIRATGATPVLGTYTDRDIVARHAEEADIVVNCADADNVDFVNAILDGLKKRKESGKGVGILIHTSGSAVFADGTKEGKLVEGGKVWNDGNVDDIKAITADKFHGDVDVLILQASSRGDVYSYIVAPAGVHGLGTGPVGRISGLTKFNSAMYAKAGHAFVLGEGTNVIGFVHISDLASLYLLIFNDALENYPPTTTPYERYFSASSELVSWGKIAELFGKALHRRGKLPSPDVVKQTIDVAGPMAAFLGGNTFTKEERGPALGWVRSGPSFTETLEGDLDVLSSSQ